MNHFQEKLKKEAKNIQLSAGEKNAMRLRLKEAVGTTPAGAAPSPYFFYSFQFTSVARYALAGLLVATLAGGTTVSAAAGALPGDWLYAVKTGFNERVELAFAGSVEGKMRTETRLAERRVVEAETLEAEGRLNIEIAEQIEKNFDKHAARALSFALSARVPSALTRIANDTSLESSVSDEGDAAPMMLMAMPVGEAGTDAAGTQAESKFEAAVEVETAVEERIDEVLQKHRDRFQRLKERANERRLQGKIKGDYKASTPVDTPLLEAGVRATSSVEAGTRLPLFDDGGGGIIEGLLAPTSSEQERIEKIKQQSTSPSGGATPLERVIENVLPPRSL